MHYLNRLNVVTSITKKFKSILEVFRLLQTARPRAGEEKVILFNESLMLQWVAPHSSPKWQSWISPVAHNIKSQTTPNVRKVEMDLV